MFRSFMLRLFSGKELNIVCNRIILMKQRLFFLKDGNDHAYCKKCILRWLRNGNTNCPIGNEKIDINKLKPIIRIVKNILSE